MYLPLNRILVKVFFVAFSLLFVCCSKQDYKDSSLSNALKLAGDNKIELQKVLDCYSQNPKDSLKYKAACFLIENMQYYSYYEGEQLDNFCTYYKLLSENRLNGVSSNDLAASVKRKFGNFNIGSLTHKKDIETIDSAYLCHNIEWAFKVWEEMPWGANILFDDFCEYILPYRIGNEKLEYWREDYYNEYFPLIEHLLDHTVSYRDDPIEAVHLIMRTIARHEDIHFTTTTVGSLPHVGPIVAKYKSGSCRELCDYVVYVCRALGIPCHIDFMPLRGNDNVGHFWVSFYDRDHELWSQDFPDPVKRVNDEHLKWVSKTKVYRHIFSLNRKIEQETLLAGKDIPELFEEPKFVDVTYQYARDYSDIVSFPKDILYDAKQKDRILYVCNASFADWIPVDYATVKGDNIILRDIQKGTVLRLVGWNNGRLETKSDPFLLDPFTNEVILLSPKKDKQEMTVLSKFEVDGEGGFRERMYGGVFEGSNDSGFKKADTILLINDVPKRLYIEREVKTDKKYRYVRYLGQPGGHCNIAEAAFYENIDDETPLEGRVIGTPSKNTTLDYINVFDGLTTTSFDHDAPFGGWAGIDLRIPKSISHIVFTPRNRDNYIRLGYEYELFYCDNTWKSLGIVQSKSDSITFSNVPKDALFYLVCRTTGRQERIFTYENGKQIWR